MSQLLPELRVDIRKLGNEFFAITKDNDGRELCTNQFQHNPTGLTHLGPLWLLERGTLDPNAMSGRGGPAGFARREQVAFYGRRLYDYLFGNAKQLRKFLHKNEAYRQSRLTLSIHSDAASLWRLPWEYLYNGQDFVCLSGHMQLARVPDGVTELTPESSPLPLRILIVIASPKDQQALDAERELAVILETLDDPVCAGDIQMEVLAGATLSALRAALDQQSYHVIHYIGHGKYTSNQKGFLCFENDTGNTDAIGAVHLKPLVDTTPGLRWVILSACQSAQVGVLSAFEHIAVGLLQLGVPAVLSVPISLQDESAIALSRALYTTLARGDMPGESLFKARAALQELDNDRPEDRRRFDWGVPALYTRAQTMQVVDPSLPPEPDLTLAPFRAKREVEGLTIPRVFVDRRHVLQSLRDALREHIPALYLWGAGGIGKSAIAAKLIESPGVELEDVLVIRCQEYPYPVAALEIIAQMWRSHRTEAHLQAATLLLDARQEPTERAREALQIISDHSTLIVFDNLDAWFEQTQHANFYLRDVSIAAEIADETIRAVLSGFLSARTGTSLLFTGRQRWRGLASLPLQDQIEISVPLLPQHHAILLMNALPRLSKASLDEKMTVFQHIGGHPKALELLDGWLDVAGSLRDFLEDPSARDRVAETWQYHFLDALLDHLDPGERETLNVIAVWDSPFCAERAAQLTDILASHMPPLLKKWNDMTLIEFHHQDEQGETWYTLHPVVRDHIVEHLSPDVQRLLHARVAQYYGTPFVEEARRQIASRSLSTWSEERIGWLARDVNGVLGIWVRQTKDLDYARRSLNRALAWQYHLLQAGEIKAAAQIVRPVALVLNRWEQRDYARALFLQSTAGPEGDDRTESMRNLADLDLELGHLTEALSVYEEVYQTLEHQNARGQMGYVLNRIGNIYQQTGNNDQAIEKYTAALKLMRESGDENGQILCLHYLTGTYKKLGAYKKALAHSQAAKELYCARDDRAGQAAILREQGRLLKELGQFQNALEVYHQSVEVARSMGDEVYVADGLEEIATLLQQGKQVDSAIKVLEEALKIYGKQDGLRAKATTVLDSLGKLYQQQSKTGEAMKRYAQAKQLIRNREQSI